jgi:pimeloyl-ACP methyl ester carboxylesterase
MLLLLGDGTRAGLGRPLLVGLGELARVALRAAADQPWAWRALVLVSPATDPASAAGTAALERLLGRLGGGPGWAGIAPDAPPR